MGSVEETIRLNNLSRELRKYGLAENSEEAIAKAGQIYGMDGGTQMVAATSASMELAQLSKEQLNELLNKMQRLWVFKDNTNQKINLVADQLVKVTDKLNELIKSIAMIEMNQAVFDKKINSLKDNIHDIYREEPARKESSSSRQVREASSQEKEVQRKLNKPIDRNNVAPADVSVEKIFYFGAK